MNQWEIWDFDIPNPIGDHPCVILSTESFLKRGSSHVNVLICTSKRGTGIPANYKVQLDQADGLDGPSLVDCSSFQNFPMKNAKRKRGIVTPLRRVAIGNAIRIGFQLTIRI